MQTIIRTLKLKTTSDIAASDNHCRRISLVENADPQKQHLNFEYDGNNSVQFAIINKTQSLSQRIEIIEQERSITTPRKDSVKCVELVMAAPPGLFAQEGTPTEKNSFEDGGPLHTQPKPDSLFAQWLQANYRFAKNYFATESDYTNVVSMQVHLDETNPHLHIHVMPIHKGRYNCKHYLGGSLKMQALQDAYYATMKNYVPQIEWERGEKKAITGKDHQTVKAWYQKLARIEQLGLGKQLDEFIEKTLEKAQNESKDRRQEVHELIAGIEQQIQQIKTESQKLASEQKIARAAIVKVLQMEVEPKREPKHEPKQITNSEKEEITPSQELEPAKKILKKTKTQGWEMER